MQNAVKVFCEAVLLFLVHFHSLGVAAVFFRLVSRFYCHLVGVDLPPFMSTEVRYLFRFLWMCAR